MDTETLNAANHLVDLISTNKLNAENKRLLIFAIENKSGRECRNFKTSSRKIEYYASPGERNLGRTEKIEIPEMYLDDEIILKILRHEKYVAENLVKKYELELSKL